MDCRDPETLDKNIRLMLQAEPMRSVPVGFGRKVKARVTLAAMLDWERQRWRYVAAIVCVVFVSVLICMAVAAVFPRTLEIAIMRLVPGGAGYADYVLSMAWYGGYGLAAAIGLVAVAALGAAAGLTYLVQRRRSLSPMGRS